MAEGDVYAKNEQISHAILTSPRMAPIMEDYLSRVCQRLIDLHDEPGISEELVTYQAYTSRPAQGGRVLPEFIRRIPSEGNFRVKIGFINDIAVGNQKFLWRLLATPEVGLRHNINISVLNKRLQRIHTLTGISDTRSLMDFHSAYPNAPMPNGILNLSYDGPVMLSRYKEYPLLSSVRTARKEEERQRLAMHNHQANPPLSDQEFEYFEKRYPPGLPETKEHNFVLPWQTGAMYWDIDHNSFYGKLAKHYNQLLIAGPSGSTELCMEVFELFNDFDVFVATMCCAAWLCNRNDHSLWEVLLAAIPFGLKYSSEHDAYDVVNHWLQDIDKRDSDQGRIYFDDLIHY
jgi:hypothetical protein